MALSLAVCIIHVLIDNTALQLVARSPLVIKKKKEKTILTTNNNKKHHGYASKYFVSNSWYVVNTLPKFHTHKNHNHALRSRP